MTKKDNLSMLHTRPEDEDFHRSRRMFVIKNEEVKIGPKNVKDSHMEWFTKEGWIKEENAEEFMKTHVRGFYIEKTNSLYCYRGTGFGFNEEVRAEILNSIEEIKKAFNFDNETKIYLGPRDTSIYGIDWPTIYLGNIKELIDR